MKYKISASKKSVVIDEALPLVILLIFFFLFALWIKFSDTSQNNKTIDDIRKQSDLLDVHKSLMQYLKMVDENGENRMDFLSKNYDSGNYDLIREDLEFYFKPKFSDFQMWRMEIYDYSDSNILKPPLRISGRNFADTELHINQAASITIPINSQKSKTLVFKVWFGRHPQ